MTRQIQNAMAQRARNADDRAGTRLGTISSYDPNTFSVKVQLQPSGLETGWIPLGSPWVGSGWGMFCAPAVGEMVEVEFQEGGAEAGVVSMRFFNDVERPLPVPAGEFWLVHQSGSLLKFHNDGTVEVTAAATMQYTATQHHFIGPVVMDNTLQVTQQIAGNGGMAIQGGTGAAMQVTGDMHSTGTITGDTDVIAAGKSGKGHTHRENGTGSNTNPPT